jgi:hypothetical protein
MFNKEILEKEREMMKQKKRETLFVFHND